MNDLRSEITDRERDEEDARNDNQFFLLYDDKYTQWKELAKSATTDIQSCPPFAFPLILGIHPQYVVYDEHVPTIPSACQSSIRVHDVELRSLLQAR